MNGYDWYSSDDANKQIRRNAADAFLSDVLDNVNGIGDAVTGLDPVKKDTAHKEFRKRVQKAAQDAGQQGDLPDGVEVICLEPDTTNRSNLVVFILHKKGAKISEPDMSAAGDLWQKRWTAAWPPY